MHLLIMGNIRKNPKKLNWTLYYFPILILVSLLIRLYLSANLEGYTRDQLFFVDWMNTVYRFGLGEVYKYGDMVNYPPLFLFLLGLYKGLLSILHLQPAPGDILVRIPSILFDMISILIFILVSKKIDNQYIRAALVTFFALNPAIIMDSAVWGQIDMLHSIMMVGSILLLTTNPLFSGIIYALSLLAKFQSIVIAPIIFIFFLKYMIEHRSIKLFRSYLLGFIIPIVTFGGYFALHGTLITMIENAYMEAVGTFPTVTVYAMNIWYYAIGTTPETLDTTLLLPHVSIKRVGLFLLFVAVCLTCLYMLLSRKDNKIMLLKAGTFLSFSFFMLPTQMHERYGFPALIFILFMLIYQNQMFITAFGLTVTTFLNLLMACYTGTNPHTGMFVVIINCLLYVSIFKFLLNDFDGLIPNKASSKNIIRH